MGVVNGWSIHHYFVLWKCLKVVLAYAVLFSKQEHSGRVFRLQFDEFQIVSSSHDDTILIWDFLRGPAMDGVGDAPRSPRTYTYVAK